MNPAAPFPGRSPRREFPHTTALSGAGWLANAAPLPAASTAAAGRKKRHAVVGVGSRSGGDRLLLDDLFLPEKPADKYLRAADQRGGADSILTGIAANHSIGSGQAVEIASLVPDLALPDYPAMPGRADPVPMPPEP